LRLAVLPLFASHQLMPRLPESAEAAPRTAYRSRHRLHSLARLGEGVDAAIVLARERSGAVRAAARSQTV
jgi:LysR family glycine cleavage system transcriptional activator